MLGRSSPSVGHLEPARIRSGIGQELRNRADRQGWVDLDDERNAEQPGDSGNVSAEVEIHTVEERRIDHVHGSAHEQRVAVGAALTTARVAMLPLSPGRFSTMNA